MIAQGIQPGIAHRQALVQHRCELAGSGLPPVQVTALGSGSGPLDRPTGFPADAFAPKPDWQLVARYQPQPDPVMLAAEALGLPRLMPERLWRKLRHRHQGVELYQVEPARGEGAN